MGDQSQPEAESLPERLRLNACRRAHETQDQAAGRRVACEIEAANRVEELTKALEPILQVIEREWRFNGAHPHRAAMIEHARRALAPSLEGRGGAT